MLALINQYNGSAIIDEETKREERIKQLIAEYKYKFIEQSHFEIRFEKMNITFDPRNMMPIDDKGTVYPKISLDKQTDCNLLPQNTKQTSPGNLIDPILPQVSLFEYPDKCCIESGQALSRCQHKLLIYS